MRSQYIRISDALHNLVPLVQFGRRGGRGDGGWGVPMGGVLLLVELQAKACNFAGGSTPP